MRVTISGESAHDLVEGAKLHGDTPADQLSRAICLLSFLEEQELAGCKIIVHDPKQKTVHTVLLSGRTPLDDEDHIAMWRAELES